MLITRSVSKFAVASVQLTVALGLFGCRAPCEDGFGRASDGNCYPIADTGDTGDTDGTSDTGDTGDTGDTDTDTDTDTDNDRWLVGDITIATTTAAQTFCQQYDAVAGNVTVAGSQLVSLDDLACLTKVDGSLIIVASELETVRLPHLVHVGSEASITHNDTLTTIDFPVLEAIHGDMHLGPLLDGYASVAFPVLAGVGGEVVVDMDNVSTLDLDAVETVGGKFKVQAGEYLNTLTLSALTSVGGDFDIGQPDLGDATFGALQSVGGDFVFSVSGLTDMDGFAGLRTIGGNVQINGNPLLTDITGLYGITSVAGDLAVESNPNLPTSQANGLVTAIGDPNIGGTVVIANNGPG